ncbi:hypothetical protein CI374_15625 [Salmonella enterica subsp. enterica serovar Panama]|nr:hypothetical protein [Salmonella enterica subsp. enterica serovar Panama]
MTDVNAFCVPSSDIIFVTGEWVNQIQRDLVRILMEAWGTTVSAAPAVVQIYRKASQLPGVSK